MSFITRDSINAFPKLQSRRKLKLETVVVSEIDVTSRWSRDKHTK
jgi:hypothetical protein